MSGRVAVSGRVATSGRTAASGRLPFTRGLLAGLISYWKLDEASGNRVDSHGANTLTSNNAVGQAAGKIASAAQFTAASSQYLSAADNASLNTGDMDFSIAGWINFNSPAINTGIIGKATSAGVREYMLQVSTGGTNVAFRIFNSAGTSVGTTPDVTVANATWVYVIVWHGVIDNMVNIQANNGAVLSAATTGVSSDTAAEFRIGNNIGNFFNGLVDEVGFWKRILTTAERTQLYNGGAGLAYPFA